MKVGVLALQGDFGTHAAVLEELGAHPVMVRRSTDLAGLDGLVFPGGESTTMSLLMDSPLEGGGLGAALGGLLGEGIPAFGTCAGMILLAREVRGGRAGQRCFGAIDVSVRRNAFGTQVESFECDLEVSGVRGPSMRAVFIRAPLVERAGPAVEVLASVGAGGPSVPGALSQAWPVVCRQGPVLVAAFHPECPVRLGDKGDPRLHELWLAGAGLAGAGLGG